MSGCTNLLYHPDAFLYVNEKTLKLPPSEVELSIEGQTELLSWYFEASAHQRKSLTIVFAHGNGQNMSSHFRSLNWILEEGFNFFIVGYPGYGPNDGKPSPKSTVQTVLSALQWVKTNRPKDSILILGQSLGGNIALRAFSELSTLKSTATNQDQICAIVVEGTFLSYRKISQVTLSRKWWLWPFQWLPYLLIDDSRSIEQNMSNLPKAKYLVIHGKEDKVVPYKLGEELFHRLPDQKEMWSIEGGGHIDTFIRFKNYREAFIKFLDKHCLGGET